MLLGLLVTILLVIAICVLIYGLDKPNKSATYVGIALFLIWALVGIVH